MNRPLKIFFICTLLMIAALRLGTSLTGQKLYGRFIHSDAEGYYMYLPAILIYGGFEGLPVKTKDHFVPYKDTGKIFTKYTYGVSVLLLPFFAVAYLINLLTGTDPDQYITVAYSVAILSAACFYGVLGLFFLYKTLVREMGSQAASLLSCAVLLFGTNLLFYMVREPGMSHVYAFFLISLLLYLTPGLYQKGSWGSFMGMGLLSGLMILIRPTDGLVLLYPLLFGVDGWGKAGERVRFYKKNFPKVLATGLLLVLAWLPQMYYWHYLTGDWLFYSYTHEGFQRWLKPEIVNVLAGPLNGWLTYNPVLVFSLVGMPFLVKGNRSNGAAVLFIFLLSLYLFASWWMWWFGGAYGYRPFVDLLPLLAVPLCFAVKKILAMQALPRAGLLVLLALCCLYNFRLILLFSWDWSNEQMNWGAFGAMLKGAFF